MRKEVNTTCLPQQRATFVEWAEGRVLFQYRRGILWITMCSCRVKVVLEVEWDRFLPWISSDFWVACTTMFFFAVLFFTCLAMSASHHVHTEHSSAAFAACTYAAG